MKWNAIELRNDRFVVVVDSAWFLTSSEVLTGYRSLARQFVTKNDAERRAARLRARYGEEAVVVERT